MMKRSLLSVLLLFFLVPLFSQMHINDPQSWWGEAPAALENIEFEVRTIGAYAETAIAFDVKLDGNDHYFHGVEQLEFVFDFQLNEGAVVNDSWLWINEYISVGEVYEQGEGTQIYESIVDRQQDPSILTQLSSTDYNLKIYPMKWDSTRRVRISYLEPLDYVGKNAFVNLPLNLLNHSHSVPENIRIKIYDNVSYSNTGLSSDSWMLLEEGVDFKTYTNNYVFERNELNAIQLPFLLDQPESDYFLSTYDTGEESYYQLVYFPEINVEQTRENRMIIFDYDSFTSIESFDEVKGKLHQSLLEMGDEDYFIICNSDFITRFSSEDWVQATVDNIENALNNIVLNSEDVESRLSTLLPEALNKVEELGLDAEITLLSPNNEYVEEQKAKSFINSIKSFYNEMQVEVKISIVDYTRVKITTLIDGIQYEGNDYIYEELAAFSGGRYYSKLEGDEIYTSLVQLYNDATIQTDQYNFQLSVEDGFIYADYDNLKSELQISNRQPIISTGKYIGEGLFDLKFNAKVGEELITDIQKLEVNSAFLLDEMITTIWNAEFIKSIQHSGDFEDKRDVISTSISERLLSLHTVFLCLEPGLESISANNNDNGGDIVILTVEEPEEEQIKLKAYPNPFVERLTIEFTIEDIIANDEVVIHILNAQGELIEKITKINGYAVGSNSVVWEPVNEIADGMYIVQLFHRNEVYNQKVLHVRP